MTKLSDITLPDEAARYVAAQVDAGRFHSVDEALAAGVGALQERDEDSQEWLAWARKRFAEASAAFDRGEGIEMTPDDSPAPVSAVRFRLLPVVRADIRDALAFTRGRWGIAKAQEYAAPVALSACLSKHR
jgi:Arc/MetJ-type ribon-helix-helix transcriptional regulator